MPLMLLKWVPVDSAESLGVLLVRMLWTKSPLLRKT